MKNKIITPMLQLATLRVKYPEGEVVDIHRNGWTWIHQLQPRASSPFYRFKIVYNENRPRVYVLDKLELAEGQCRLPHVYSHEKQQLCLYLPNGREWNATMQVSKIIPWISRWLYFYESWVITGEWQGGGVHVSDENYQRLFTCRSERRLKERQRRKRKSPKARCH